MFWGQRNEDTTAASRARQRSVSVVTNGKRKVYRSVKACSLDIGIPSSRICEYAKRGCKYRGSYVFEYV